MLFEEEGGIIIIIYSLRLLCTLLQSNDHYITYIYNIQIDSLLLYICFSFIYVFHLLSFYNIDPPPPPCVFPIIINQIHRHSMCNPNPSSYLLLLLFSCCFLLFTLQLIHGLFAKPRRETKEGCHLYWRKQSTNNTLLKIELFCPSSISHQFQ